MCDTAISKVKCFDVLSPHLLPIVAQISIDISLQFLCLRVTIKYSRYIYCSLQRKFSVAQISVTPLLMSIGDRLYEVQLRLKKNDVNKKRKNEEVASLMASFETQIQNYLYALYSSAVSIWTILNTNKEQILTQFAKIKPQPELPLLPQEFGIKAMELRDSNEFFEETGKSPLSLENFLLTLTIYKFLWSSEAVDLFLTRLLQQNPTVISNFASCFLIHPLTQVYFTSVLRKVFRQLDSPNLKDVLLTMLQSYSQLLPGFLRTLLKAHPERHALFWNVFLRPILENYSVFGVEIPDLLLYEEETLNNLVIELESYFSDQSSIEFVDSVLSNPTDISIVPSELALKNVDPNYESITIVDRDCGYFDSDCPPLFYMKSESSSGMNVDLSSLDSLSQASIVKRFLLQAKLVRIERTYDTAFEYFQEIANLSCTFHDPLLEIGLDGLSSFLECENPMSIEELVSMVEANVEADESDKAEDTFAVISKYSSQFGYLTRLHKMVTAVTDNAHVYVDFLRIRNYVQSIQVDTTAPFVTEYAKVAGGISKAVGIPKPEHVVFRTVHAMLTKIYKCNFEISEEDKRIHDFLEREREELIQLQPPEFIEIAKGYPEELSCFCRELQLAFSTRMPLARVSHIHACYQSLTWILQTHGFRDIGADQLVPFAIVATVCANPIGLSTTYHYLVDYINPVLMKAAPIDHPEEYSVIQFVSTYQFLVEKMGS